MHNAIFLDIDGVINNINTEDLAPNSGASLKTDLHLKF